MLAVGPIAQGAVPFSIQVYQVWGLTITVEVLCQVQDQVYQQWQSDTYDLIVGAYKALLQAYNSEKAGFVG
jgi:hypothetical protein